MSPVKFRLYFIARYYQEYDEFVRRMADKCREAGVKFDRREVQWIYTKFLMLGRRVESRHEFGFGPSWREVCDIEFLNSRIDGPEIFTTEPAV